VKKGRLQLGEHRRFCQKQWPRCSPRLFRLHCCRARTHAHTHTHTHTHKQWNT